MGAPAFTPQAVFSVEQRFEVGDPRHDYTFSPGAGMLRLCAHDSDRFGRWWTGDFVDYRGIVTVQMEQRYTRLDAVAGGRCHVRTWQREFAERTLTRLCRAFLTDLHGEPLAKARGQSGDSPCQEG